MSQRPGAFSCMSFYRARSNGRMLRYNRPMISAIVSAFHLLALAIGLPSVFLRGRALKRPLDAEGVYSFSLRTTLGASPRCSGS